MKLPAWLPKLGPREEKVRAARGLIAKRDGWYKCVDTKTCYICKPCPVGDADRILDSRIAAIRQKRNGGAGPVMVRMTPGMLTLEQLGDAYQAWLYQRLTTGHPKKLGRRTYDDYITHVAEFVACAGRQKPADTIGPAEFSAYALKHLAKIAASSKQRKIISIEAFANWAAPGSRKMGLLSRPWHYGPDFTKPSRDEISTSAADSDKSYSPQQIRKSFLAVKDNPMLCAAGWLGLCGAFGPKDLGLLPEEKLNLESGVIRFARGKTGVGRACWLPPGARIAVSKYLGVRAEQCDESAHGLLFRTAEGKRVYREATGEEVGYRTDVISHRWSEKTGLPFSGLRTTFATLADDWPDQRAVDVVMGHKAGHRVRSVRNQNYAKKFSDERVERLVAAVVCRAFGRKTPSDLGPGQEAAQASAVASPAGSTAKPQRRPDRSSTAAGKNQDSARRSPATRRH